MLRSRLFVVLIVLLLGLNCNFAALAQSSMQSGQSTAYLIQQANECERRGDLLGAANQYISACAILAPYDATSTRSYAQEAASLLFVHIKNLHADSGNQDQLAEAGRLLQRPVSYLLQFEPNNAQWLYLDGLAKISYEPNGLDGAYQSFQRAATTNEGPQSYINAARLTAADLSTRIAASENSGQSAPMQNPQNPAPFPSNSASNASPTTSPSWWQSAQNCVHMIPFVRQSPSAQQPQQPAGNPFSSVMSTISRLAGGGFGGNGSGSTPTGSPNASGPGPGGDNSFANFAAQGRPDVPVANGGAGGAGFNPFAALGGAGGAGFNPFAALGGAGGAHPASPTGGMPGMGGMPSIPGMGGMPSIPGMGGMPSIPGMGGMPSIPGMGGMPSIPGMPRMPSMPGMGGMPSIPGMPSMPGMGGAGQGGFNPFGGLGGGNPRQ